MLNVFFFLLLFEKIVDLEKKLKKLQPTLVSLFFFFFKSLFSDTPQQQKNVARQSHFCTFLVVKFTWRLVKSCKMSLFFPFFLLLNRQQH